MRDSSRCEHLNLFIFIFGTGVASDLLDVDDLFKMGVQGRDTNHDVG